MTIVVVPHSLRPIYRNGLPSRGCMDFSTFPEESSYADLNGYQNPETKIQIVFFLGV